MMEYGINRNGSGYVDLTAYKAIKNIIKSEEKTMELYKGDIVDFELNNGLSKEAIILSMHDNYSSILVLSDKVRSYSVNCRGMKYIDPGMVQYVFNDKITGYIRSMSDQEYADIMQAVVDALGYEAPVKEVLKEVVKESEPEFIPPAATNDLPFDNAIREEMAQLKAERNVYKELYENLISSMIAK